MEHRYHQIIIFFYSIEFYDELSKVESSVDIGSGEGEGERDGNEPPQVADFSVKALKLSGLTVELGNEHIQDTKLNGMYVCLTVKNKSRSIVKIG